MTRPLPARGTRLPPVRRSTVLVALLAATLVLAAVLAYEAHDAARSHRATAERALRDYATFAAWELLADATDAAQPALVDALAPVTGSRATTPYEVLPAPSVLASSAAGVLRCADAADDAARVYFRIDFRDGSLATAGASALPRQREMVERTVVEQARSVYRPDWKYAAFVAGTARARRAVVYAIRWAEHGAPIAAYGWTTCPSALGQPLFARVMREHPLLPSSLTGGEPNDSLVSVVVLSSPADTVFRSAALAPSPFTADATLERFGGLTARASLRPRAIQKLALGALPGSKLPLLLGLLTLTAGLVAVAVLQLRREQELARLRSDFISSVSHELRTPLAQILLFAETLSLGRVRSDDERRDAADVIVQEARRLGQLVENVLHFSRAERRMATLSPETLQLAPFVQGIVHSWTPLAGACDVHVRTELDESAVAVVDRGALRQMLLNLLDNAAKYGPAGQTITVAVERNEHVVRVRVDDEGPGIPTDQRARVWEPFFRLPRDVASATAGSGIGLFVVRELALLQGGSVRLEQSAVGGARVVFELPAGANDGTRHSALDDGAEQRSASAECRVAPFTSVKA